MKQQQKLSRTFSMAHEFHALEDGRTLPSCNAEETQRRRRHSPSTGIALFIHRHIATQHVGGDVVWRLNPVSPYRSERPFEGYLHHQQIHREKV